MRFNTMLDGRKNGTEQTEKQDACTWVVVRRIARANIIVKNQAKGKVREQKETRVVAKTELEKRGHHVKGVVICWGVSIRGGVPVDILSVPRLPLRLHSLAASRTGSKRLALEVAEDAGADIGACAGTGERSSPPPPRDVEREGRGAAEEVVERRRPGSARSVGREKRAAGS